MNYTYMVECSDGSFYVGSTRNLEKRIAEHNEGLGAAYTRTRRPVVLVWHEQHRRIDDAFHREKQIQNWGRKKRLALIEQRYADLPDLAERHAKRRRRERREGTSPGLDTPSASASDGSTT